MHENVEEINHMTKKRKYDFTDEKNGVSSNKLLLLTPSPSLYHVEGIATSPYDLKMTRQENLYLPMKDTIYINIQVYDEILVRNGVHFLGDDNGRYDKTAEGVSYNFLRYNKKEKKMCNARSFLCTSSEKANEISNFLAHF